LNSNKIEHFSKVSSVTHSKIFNCVVSLSIAPCVFNQPILGLQAICSNLQNSHFDDFAVQTATASGPGSEFVFTIFGLFYTEQAGRTVCRDDLQILLSGRLEASNDDDRPVPMRSAGLV